MNELLYEWSSDFVKCIEVRAAAVKDRNDQQLRATAACSSRGSSSSSSSSQKQQYWEAVLSHIMKHSNNRDSCSCKDQLHLLLLNISWFSCRSQIVLCPAILFFFHYRKSDLSFVDLESFEMSCFKTVASTLEPHYNMIFQCYNRIVL